MLLGKKICSSIKNGLQKIFRGRFSWNVCMPMKLPAKGNINSLPVLATLSWRKFKLQATFSRSVFSRLFRLSLLLNRFCLSWLFKKIENALVKSMRYQCWRVFVSFFDRLWFKRVSLFLIKNQSWELFVFLFV